MIPVDCVDVRGSTVRARLGPLTRDGLERTIVSGDFMSRCAVCQRPVVVDPEVLADGDLVHAACKRQITSGLVRPREREPHSATRIKAARPNRRTG